VAPFIHPDLEWDFRLPNVVSINVSGHQYGLVHPGIGRAAGRSKDRLPEELVFHISYLGGDMSTFTLNFSRPGNQTLGQYYNFVRFGFEGYREIMGSLQWGVQRLSKQIEEIGPFEILSDGTDIPVVTFALKDPKNCTVYDVSSRLRNRGQVPAHPLPKKVARTSASCES